MIFASAGCNGADFFNGKTNGENVAETVLTDNGSSQTGNDASNSDGNENADYYTVSLVYGNGADDVQFSVQSGKTFVQPDDPVKPNYIFTGWYTSSKLSARYDFSKSVEQNLTLYAGYVIDAVSLTNTITTDTIKGVVKIYNKCYNTHMGMETSSSTSQGSGFCFKIEGERYYILTNCHVANAVEGYNHQKYTIEDYVGNEYQGYLYKNPAKSYNAIAAEYDLACLYFESDSAEVKELAFANDNPAVKDDIILLGAPKGQPNAITYGTVSGYANVQTEGSTDDSNVTFQVIESSAYSNHGSSGGPAFNSNLQIVGVCYAGNESRTKSYSIPVLKVKEFLETFVY